MIKRFKSSKIVLSDGLFDGSVYVENGVITEVTARTLPCDETIDLGDKYLSPGFIDMHLHGGAGVDFGSCDSEGAKKAARYHMSHGTTTLLPTLTASSFEATVTALENLSPIVGENEDCPFIPGIHLEGPYFSVNQCGAQNIEFITAPKKDEYTALLDRFGDVISRWSYAPERDENGEFCKTLKKVGVIPSAGHTDAVQQDMETAFNNGCELVTHLYSCTSTVTRDKGFRRLGVIEYTFLKDGITAEIIADGKHLPADLIKMIFKIKGRERVALVTDALSIAGADIKSGDLNGVPFIVEDGVCKLSDRSAFAGSIATADVLVRTCVKEAGISVVDSVYMASGVPARLLGLKKGRIEKEFDADFAVLDDDLKVSGVYIGGNLKG